MRKYKQIIAKLLIIVMFVTVLGESDYIYAEDSNEKQANTSSGIVTSRYYEDLYIDNISLLYANRQSTLVLDVENRGTTTFKGNLYFRLYNGNGEHMITLEGYVWGEIEPGVKRTVTMGTNLNLMSAVSMEVTKSKDEPTDNTNISGSRTVAGMLQLNNIRLYLGKSDWCFQCSYKVVDDAFYDIMKNFEMYLTFRDEMGAVLFDETVYIHESQLSAIAVAVFYTDVDLSRANSLDITTNLSEITPTAKPTPSPPVSSSPPTATPTPTATAQPTPTHTVENTSAPQPTRDASVTEKPVFTPNIPGETEPSQAPGITPTERPATPTQGTQLPSETAPLTPTPTLPVSAKPSGTPIPTAQPQPSAPTQSPGITDMPTASPTARPTQTPAVSKPGKTKLMRPVIRIKIRKIYNKMWMAEIRLKKYQGTDIQIYYRRGKGKFKKIKLRRHNIKKNKKIFKVGYKKGNKEIYLRVRTYQKKGGKMWYSRYSKIRRLS